MTTKSLTDIEIINHVLDGNKEVFAHLIRRYNQQLFRVGIAYLKNDEDTQDAMQSTFLKVYEKLSSFKNESKFSTWIVRVMINECLHIIRKSKKIAPYNHTKEILSPELNGVQLLVNQEMKELFEKSIIGLPEKYRAIYIFRALNEYSTKETAACLNISEENVKVRYYRAKQLLKDQLLNTMDPKETFEFLGERCEQITYSVMSIILNKAFLS